MSEYRLILGDCLEVMRTMDAGSVDAVITDPPYGVDFRGQDWDAFIPAWIGEARRISKVVVFTTAPTTLWDYPRADWVNNWYRAGSTSRNNKGGFCHWSPIIVYGDVFFQVDTFVTSAVLTGMQNKGIDHPSPKDVNMVRWLVENASNVGSVVFDPFCGSGTTGVACMQLGRDFIGIDISSEYLKIAEKRIKQAAAQMILPLDMPADVENP